MRNNDYDSFHARSGRLFDSVCTFDEPVAECWKQAVVLAQAIPAAGTEIVDHGWWVKERSLLWFDYFLMQGYEEDRWLKCLLMPKEAFLSICADLHPAVRRQDICFRRVVPVEVKVGAVLYKLVTGVNLFHCGELFGIGESSVHEFMEEVITAIISVLGPKHLVWPSIAGLEAVAEGFRKKCGLIQCQGAIDGSHIRIRAPIGKEVAVDYYNHKGFHSILLQGICDSDSVFLDVAVGFPGSMHDKRMLRLSKFYDLVQSGKVLQEPTVQLPNGVLLRPYILGDAGYRLASADPTPADFLMDTSATTADSVPGVTQLRAGDCGQEVRQALAEYLALAT
ncbi:hypothetical protein R1sor_015560 [Riccia sorocarpa]|uniref:DDE Tnp4 domain-containing protein n=1 Tax=Riccia sorocarpa TaxID=122646 RepID=A0ABD3HEE1_9MARC